MDIKAFTAYLKASKFGHLLDDAQGAGKTESDSPRLFAVYQRYQVGEINLQEMAAEMGYLNLGLDAAKIKFWLPKLVPRDLGCKVNIIEITPRTQGFEDEAQQHLARGGQIRDIRGGELGI